MESEYEGNRFMPERIAYLPNTLDNIQVESSRATYKKGEGTLYVSVFHPLLLPSSFFHQTETCILSTLEMTKTRDTSVPFGNSVEAEAIAIELLQPAPG